MNEVDDRTLVARVVRGERAAFRILVERHQSRVLGLVGAIVSPGADREDVAQETFLAAWRSLAAFDPERGSFAAWLLRIARNRALNARRDGRRRATLAQADPEASDAPPLAERAAAFAHLDRALTTLGEDQRIAFVLAEIHGLDVADVAEIERVPIGTIKSRLSRAREALRAALREAFPASASPSGEL